MLLILLGNICLLKKSLKHLIYSSKYLGKNQKKIDKVSSISTTVYLPSLWAKFSKEEMILFLVNRMAGYRHLLKKRREILYSTSIGFCSMNIWSRGQRVCSKQYRCHMSVFRHVNGRVWLHTQCIHGALLDCVIVGTTPHYCWLDCSVNIVATKYLIIIQS